MAIDEVAFFLRHPSSAPTRCVPHNLTQGGSRRGRESGLRSFRGNSYFAPQPLLHITRGRLNSVRQSRQKLSLLSPSRSSRRDWPIVVLSAPSSPILDRDGAGRQPVFASKRGVCGVARRKSNPEAGRIPAIPPQGRPTPIDLHFERVPHAPGPKFPWIALFGSPFQSYFVIGRFSNAVPNPARRSACAKRPSSDGMKTRSSPSRRGEPILQTTKGRTKLKGN